MKKIAAQIFIALLFISGIPAISLANINSPNGFDLVSSTGISNFLPTPAQRRYSIRFRNNSRWNIRRIYVSSAETTKWGPDQLGSKVLYSNTAYTLTDFSAGEYDFMFIDEDNDKCILRNVQIFENKDWNISSDWLVTCQKNSR